LIESEKTNIMRATRGEGTPWGVEGTKQFVKGVDGVNEKSETLGKNETKKQKGRRGGERKITNAKKEPGKTPNLVKKGGCRKSVPEAKRSLQKRTLGG